MRIAQPWESAGVLRAMQARFRCPALVGLAILVSLAIASSASAQDASEIRELVEINKLRKQAEQQESDGQFAVCAHTYMSLYEKHPNARRGDELLYNAVVCYEAALLAGEAIRTLHILESRFSSSSLAAKGILRLSLIHI